MADDLDAALTPKNVLLLVTDDCNCDLSIYGHATAKTPNIDRLAERGVRFGKAYCQYPVCNPSRSSFMTSLYPDQTGVLTNAGNFRNKNPNVVTLAQMFRNHGYIAARIGKIYHYGVPTQIGTDGADDLASWDTRFNPRGIDREVHDRINTLEPGKFGGTLSWLKLPSKPEQHTDGIAATEACRLLQELHPDKTQRPFFLAVGFYRPHTPYVAPPEHFDLHPRSQINPVMEKPGDRDDIPLAALHDRPKQRELTVAQRKEIIQAYYASISLMDQQLGRVLDALDELDLTKDTVVVFISDHGYHLGQHGLWQKGDLFEGSCRVPMIIADPSGKQRGVATNSLVELVDLYPTLAELCNVNAPDHVKGKSLVPVLGDPEKSVRDTALTVTVSRAHRMHPELPKDKRIMGYSIRTERYRYTEWGDGGFGRELYDYKTDPEELTNLIDSESHRSIREELKSLFNQAKRMALPSS
ncbi:MAG: sulfatase [Planctomycetales bacterium]|nr:sulfatase [Planctomycetales bacterium]